MENLKGKITIIVKSATHTTKELEEMGHKLAHFALQTGLWDRHTEVFVVPSDEEPYNGPDYPPGTNAGSP